MTTQPGIPETPSGAPIRVLCVDDNARLTDAWRELLRHQADMEVVGTLDRADDLTRVAVELQARVVLMDLTMEGADPLDAIRNLAHARPDIRVLVYSGHNDAQSAELALDAGAWGYIAKHESPQRIQDAVRRLAAGEMVIPPSLTARTSAKTRQPSSPPRSEPASGA